MLKWSSSYRSTCNSFAGNLRCEHNAGYILAQGLKFPLTLLHFASGYSVRVNEAQVLNMLSRNPELGGGLLPFSSAGSLFVYFFFLLGLQGEEIGPRRSWVAKGGQRRSRLLPKA